MKEEKDEGRKRRWTQRFGDFVWDNEFKQQGFMYKEAGRYIINEEKKENFLRYINGLEEASKLADQIADMLSFRTIREAAKKAMQYDNGEHDYMKTVTNKAASEFTDRLVGEYEKDDNDTALAAGAAASKVIDTATPAGKIINAVQPKVATFTNAAANVALAKAGATFVSDASKAGVERFETLFPNVERPKPSVKEAGVFNNTIHVVTSIISDIAASNALEIRDYVAGKLQKTDDKKSHGLLIYIHALSDNIAEAASKDSIYLQVKSNIKAMNIRKDVSHADKGANAAEQLSKLNFFRGGKSETLATWEEKYTLLNMQDQVYMYANMYLGMEGGNPNGVAYKRPDKKDVDRLINSWINESGVRSGYTAELTAETASKIHDFALKKTEEKHTQIVDNIEVIREAIGAGSIREAIQGAQIDDADAGKIQSPPKFVSIDEVMDKGDKAGDWIRNQLNVYPSVIVNYGHNYFQRFSKDETSKFFKTEKTPDDKDFSITSVDDLSNELDIKNPDGAISIPECIRKEQAYELDDNKNLSVFMLNKGQKESLTNILSNFRALGAETHIKDDNILVKSNYSGKEYAVSFSDAIGGGDGKSMKNTVRQVVGEMTLQARNNLDIDENDIAKSIVSLSNGTAEQDKVDMLQNMINLHKMPEEISGDFKNAGQKILEFRSLITECTENREAILSPEKLPEKLKAQHAVSVHNFNDDIMSAVARAAEHNKAFSDNAVKEDNIVVL